MERRRLTNNLRTPTLHNIQAIRIQTRETKQLRHTLQKHHHYRERHTTDPFLHAPSIDNHTRGDDAAEENKTAAQPVLSDAVAADANVLFHNVVGVTAAEECTQQVAAAGRNIEEAGLERGLQVEAWVEDVADGG